VSEGIALLQLAHCASIASLAEWSIFHPIDRKIDQSSSLGGFRPRVISMARAFAPTPALDVEE
jgi:hypothetical protein